MSQHEGLKRPQRVCICVPALGTAINFIHSLLPAVVVHKVGGETSGCIGFQVCALRRGDLELMCLELQDVHKSPLGSSELSWGLYSSHVRGGLG